LTALVGQIYDRFAVLIGDKDLAGAIEEISRREMDDPEKLLHIRGLMAARLGQSRRIGRLP